MNAADFQLIDDEKSDDSIMNGDFVKTYHQSGANVDTENSNIKFYFGENHNFFPVGNGFLEFDIKVRKNDNSNFTIVAPGEDVIRLTENGFA